MKLNNSAMTYKTSGNFFDRLSEKKFRLVAIFLIVSLTGAVYFNSLTNQFTNWDDDKLVFENDTIRSLSLDNLKRIFTPSAGGTYQPIRVLSYAIDYHLWQLNPVGYHVMNTVLHCIAAIFLYLSLSNGLNQLRGISVRKSNRSISLFTALLFTVHPVNVESVAWISSRKYGLLALFSFLSFYLFVKSSAEERYRWSYAGLSLAAATLAVMSSPFGVIVPGWFLLYDYCRDRSNNLYVVLRRHFLYYLPYGAAGIIVVPLLWNLLVTSDTGGAAKTHHLDNPLYTLLSMLRVLFDYVRNLLFPLWLNSRYVDHISTTLFNYKIIVSITVTVLLFFLIFIHMMKRNKISLFCLGWFLVAWLPVSNIIPISTLMADRYLYLAAVGLFLGFSLLLQKLSELFVAVNLNRIMCSVFKAALLIFFSMITVQRNKVWESSVTLWKDSLEKDPQNAIAHNNLGNALRKQGRNEAANDHYQTAISLMPDFVKPHYNLGSLLLEEGRMEDAFPVLSRVLEIEPDNAKAYNNIATALEGLGKNSEAIQNYLRALQISPRYAKCYYNLGIVLVKENRINEAVRYYSEALKYAPNEAKTHNNMAIALLRIGSLEEAIQHYSEALRIQPDYADAHYNLGKTLEKKGDVSRAIRYYLEALRLDPELAEAQNNLGNARLTQGKITEAIRHYSKALQINPEYAKAHNNLGNALQDQEKFSQAIEHYLESLRIEPDVAEVYLNLGRAYQNMSNYDEAIYYYSKAADVNPEFAKAHNNLGNVLVKKSRLDEAIRHYSNAIRIKPDYAKAHYNLGFALHTQGKVTEAIQCYLEALRINPDIADAYSNLGQAMQNDGKQLKAIHYFLECLKIKPDFVVAHNKIGIAYSKLSKFDKAIHHFTEVLRINPDHKHAQRNLQIVKRLWSAQDMKIKERE